MSAPAHPGGSRPRRCRLSAPSFPRSGAPEKRSCARPANGKTAGSGDGESGDTATQDTKHREPDRGAYRNMRER
ncbi:hypothetical protein GPICK_09045 [Geobacter pickeringii]|uniref:Uncharacterized protein n=1 Tax=Geobacter pickeringii TaxID=345632 RepID=A0A0B5BA66_9BACT|nr:hypothetical protein GPICK_09045 [Geobacter pickeringii]